MNLRPLKTLAQQGDVSALTQLIDRSLQADGWQTRVTATERQLSVAVIGDTVPPETVVIRLSSGLRRLQVTRFAQLEVSGYHSERAQPAWTHTLALAADSVLPTPPTVLPPLPEPPAPPAHSAPVTRSPQNPRSRSSASAPKSAPSPATPHVWLNGFLCLAGGPLILIGSVRFFLTTQTQLFGLQDNYHPMTGIVRPSLPLYFALQYGFAALLLALGSGALVFAYRQRRALGLSLVLAITLLPVTVWLLGILTDPFLLPSPAMPQSIHPTTARVIGPGQRNILLLCDLTLLSGAIALLYSRLAPPYRRAPLQLLRDSRTYLRDHWRQHRRVAKTYLAIGVLVLGLSNPSFARHADALARPQLADLPGQPRSLPPHLLAVVRRSHQYRTLLVLSWTQTDADPQTVGILGQVYRWGVPKPSAPPRRRWELWKIFG